MPSLLPHRRNRRNWPRPLVTTVVATVGLALVASLHGPAAEATPAAPPTDELFQPADEKSVPGTDATPQPKNPDPAEQSAVRTSPTVTWPGRGAADVVVPRPSAGDTWTSVLTGRRDVTRARAGDHPVWIGPAAPATGQPSDNTPSRVRVEMLGREVDALLLRLRRSDGATKTGSVSVEVDYSTFRHAYGGDWALRLRLFRLPDCALTRPAVEGCRATLLPTRNNGSGRLTGNVTTSSAGELYAVQATSSSTAGSFGATGLAPAATWSVGGSSGDFTWSYPMDVPPGSGGPVPQVDVGYSSGSVDGRTSATNNQPSWVGEGFDLAPGGSIERRYKSCAMDLNGNNGTRSTGDLCWGTDNATFTLNGKGGELVRDDATGAWRPRGDDGSKVERLTGATNGDNNGEYWRITTKDGTQYYFGLNRLPGWTSGNPETRSSWTVPVFGNNSGEPCNAATFADSWCYQTNRWNLDYVVDRHGNTMSLFYDTESNYYGRNLTATTVSSYIRGGNVARIEYGQRAGEVFTTPAVGRVLFTTAERCIPGSTCTTSDPSTYPDTPLDQQCTSSTNCYNKYSPTFWTQKRLAKVTTQVRRGSAFTDVDSWTLHHLFPSPGDGTRAGLWLESVTNAGHVGGTAIATPEVNFDGVQMHNRIDTTSDGTPPMNWWRVKTINYGTGGLVTVTYSPQDCGPTDLPAPDTNTRRCHPMKWTPDGGAERTDWFHKYVVTGVSESDQVSGLVPVDTQVEYLGPAAWRHDDEDGLVETKFKTWSQWRGYSHVRIRKGATGGQQTITENRYFRGMDGDKLANGGVKDVKVTDSAGGQAEDLLPLAGQIREQSTFNGTQLIDRTISDHWVSGATATRVRSWGTTSSYQVEEGGNRQAELLDGGVWRNSSATNTYNANGVLLSSQDLNNTVDPADDTCTRYEYTSNASIGIDELPKRRQVVSVSCDKTFTNAQVLSDSRTYYDNATSVDTAPVRGDVTKTERLAGFNADGTPLYQTVSTATYDAIGRAVTVTDALGRTTSTAFTPTTGPVTKTAVTQPNGHTTTTELEPAWGEELAVTDPAGRRTEATYDALGRTTKVWLPGRTGTTSSPSDNAATANMDYSYLLRTDGPNVVTTKTMQTDGSIEIEHELSDGLLRPRQTQKPAVGGGRIITDVVYDSRGLAVKENGPYYNDAPPSTSVLLPDESLLPAQKVTEYDAADRPTTEIFKSLNAEKWRTAHVHAGDRQTVDPPDGDQPTTRIMDVQGRPTELRQYTGQSATGTYDKTSYTYTPRGELESVTDPAGNAWRFEYDLRGRKIKDIDPDRGVTTYTYDDLDQLVSSTDARGSTLAYAYDEVGRRTAVHDGTLTGPKRAGWVYDTLAKGSPTSATRYVGGNAYTTRVTGYDTGGRPLGNEVTIPTSEGALAGTYQFSATYNADGEIATSSLPAVGGLPAETLQYGYDAFDNPTTLASAATTYVRSTSYTAYGELSILTLGTTGGRWVQQKYAYETGTRRLSQVVTERETLPRRISNVSYAYDAGGNITKITDAPSSTSGLPTDTQCFTYDHLRRLTSAWTPASADCAAAPTAGTLGGPAPYWHSWTFDKTGNRKTETRTDTAGTTTSTYTYPAAGHANPHAVQQVTATGPSGSTTSTYGYDATGNLTNRSVAGVGETFTWDTEGHLEKVAKGTETTAYVTTPTASG